MRYPPEFSPRAQAKVEASRLRAIQNLQSKSTFAENPAIPYVLTILSTFANEACELGKQNVWTIPQIEAEVETFLYDLAQAAPNDLREAGVLVRPLVSFESLMRSLHGGRPPILPYILYALKTSPEWMKFRGDLLEVADTQSRPEDLDTLKQTMPERRGYRREVTTWMKRSTLDTIRQAAKRLGVSESTLKSIMSSKGKPRYGPETLEAILKKIGYQDSEREPGE